MDERERLYNSIARGLVLAHLPSEYIEKIMSVVAINMDDFEISMRTTELANVTKDSYQIVYMYLCTLLSEGKSEKTVKVYKGEINRFLADCGKELREYTAFDIRAYLARVQKHVSKRTAENYRSYLSSMFNWLESEEIIDKNPMKKIKPIKYEDKAKYPFSSVDIDAIRYATNKSLLNRAIVEVLLSSGIRINELCDLKIEDVDFQKLIINVRCGKGGKQRFVPMSQLASTYLQKYLLKRTDGNPWLFVSSIKPYGKQNPTNIRKAFNRIEQKINSSDEYVVTHVHPHRFRRTFATELAKRKAPIQDIQDLLGHTNIATTKLYISNTNMIIGSYE